MSFAHDVSDSLMNYTSARKRLSKWIKTVGGFHKHFSTLLDQWRTHQIRKRLQARIHVGGRVNWQSNQWRILSLELEFDIDWLNILQFNFNKQWTILPLAVTSIRNQIYQYVILCVVIVNYRDGNAQLSSNLNVYRRSDVSSKKPHLQIL